MQRSRTTRTPLRRAVALALLASVPLAACGSDGNDVDVEVTTVPGAPASDAPSDTGMAPATTMAGGAGGANSVPADETTESSDPDAPGDPVPSTPDPEIVPSS